MNLFELLLMSVGLAMDATAVSAARGLAAPRVRLADALKLSLVFGGFHVLMPLLGWLLGERVGRWILAYDHWVACVVLTGLGAKMIHEAMGDADPDDEATPDPFRLTLLLPMGVGISLDALAVGFTLPLLRVGLVPALAAIGGATAVLSLVGVYIGRRFGAALGKRLDVAGGLVLIGMGIKILVEHLRG